MTKPTASDTEVKAWDLPFVEEKQRVTQGTNAFNRRADWKYEPPEPAPEVVLPTAADIESIRQAAYEEGLQQGQQEGHDKGYAEGLEQGNQAGHEQGYAEGLEQGSAEKQQEIEQLLQHWREVTEQLTQPINQVNEQVEQEVMQLALSLARAVIRTEVSTNTEVVKSALKAGLKALPVQQQEYQIYLNADDRTAIQQYLDEDNNQSLNVTLHESADIARGGCDIVTQHNAVDVSLDRQLADVIDGFLFEHGLDAK